VLGVIAGVEMREPLAVLAVLGTVVALDKGYGAALPEEVGAAEGPVRTPEVVGRNDPVPVGPTTKVPLETGNGAEVPETGSALEISVSEYGSVGEGPVPVGPTVRVPFEVGKGAVLLDDVGADGPVDNPGAVVTAPVGPTPEVSLETG
jgi:hypothetical protein